MGCKKKKKNKSPGFFKTNEIQQTKSQITAPPNINIKKILSRHIVVKLLKTEYKRENLEGILWIKNKDNNVNRSPVRQLEPEDKGMASLKMEKGGIP